MSKIISHPVLSPGLVAVRQRPDFTPGYDNLQE